MRTVTTTETVRITSIDRGKARLCIRLEIVPGNGRQGRIVTEKNERVIFSEKYNMLKTQLVCGGRNSTSAGGGDLHLPICWNRIVPNR